MNTPKSSKRHLTGKVYPIPENKDDSQRINAFLNSNKGKKLIVVQGLGLLVQLCHLFAPTL